MGTDSISSELVASIRAIRVGERVPIGGDGLSADVYVTSAGTLILVDSSLSGRNQESRAIAYGNALWDWSIDTVDKIASQHFYRLIGQGLLVIDAMARAGYLTYADKARFENEVSARLSSGKFVLLADITEAC